MKLDIWVMTNRVGSKERRSVEIDDEDWESMDAQERDAFVWDEITNGSMLEWGYEAAQ